MIITALFIVLSQCQPNPSPSSSRFIIKLGLKGVLLKGKNIKKEALSKYCLILVFQSYFLEYIMTRRIYQTEL